MSASRHSRRLRPQRGVIANRRLLKRRHPRYKQGASWSWFASRLARGIRTARDFDQWLQFRKVAELPKEYRLMVSAEQAIRQLVDFIGWQMTYFTCLPPISKVKSMTYFLGLLESNRKLTALCRKPTIGRFHAMIRHMHKHVSELQQVAFRPP